ncbi:MAG TPA: DUF2938 domain-containing protein [Gemmatimonadales bacterium]
MEQLITRVLIGVLATAIMDIWGVVRHPLLGLPRADYRLIGRWFAYMPRGRFRHAPITASAPLPAEFLIGWTTHYAIGITFALLLVAVWGARWLEHPTVGPALLVGVVTVIAPLFLMQPAMGAPRTPRTVLQSLITHTIYGLGLYAAAWIITFIP